MKFLTALIAALVVAASAIPTICADNSNPPISGSIVDINGKPVANARVIASGQIDGKEKTQTVISDKVGKFETSLSLRANGSCANVRVLAKGYCATRIYCSQDQVAPLEITLWPGYTLKGKVLDENGKPLQWAKVTMDYAHAYGGSTNVGVELSDDVKTLSTGKDGEFSFADMPRPVDFQYIDARITVSAPGRALIHKQITKQTMSGVTKITDPLECRVYGTLYLPDKKGFAPEGTRIIVQIPTEGDMSKGFESRDVPVGKNGKFFLAKLPPYKVNLVLESPCNRGQNIAGAYVLQAVTNIELSHKRSKLLDLVLVPGALIEGKIVDKINGKPIASANLSIIHPGRPSRDFPDYAGTDANGEFAIRVVEGQTSISVESIQGQDYIYFQPDERPTLKLDVVHGKDKSDAILAIDPNQNRQMQYEAQQKPIPADFELIPGTYKLTWDPDIDLSQAVFMSSKYIGEKADAFIKALPKFVSANAKYVAYAIDGSDNDGLLLAAFDESQGTGKGWDTAYIDINRNGDLTDDQPVRLNIRSSPYQAAADWVSVQSHQGRSDGERTTNPIQVKLILYSHDSNEYFNNVISLKGGWKGIINSNKGKVECVAIDGNSNGVYGDTFVINSAKLESEGLGDSVFVDTNGYGRAVPSLWGQHGVRLYNISKVGNKYYRISTSALGNKIKVEPYMGELGQLLVRGQNIQGLDADADKIIATSELGYYIFDNCDAKLVSLPIGKYKLSSCELTLNPKNKLKMTCSPDAPVLIESGKQSNVIIGGKLSLSIGSDGNQAYLTQGSTDTINWDIKIGGKTTVNSLGDQRDMDAPKVSFVRNGKILHTVTAGYT